MASNTRDTPESMATNTAVRTPLDQPSLSWRMSSSFILGATSMLCRGFLYGLNTVETTGLDRFLEILDKRKDVDKRERGLITVCNHVSVTLSTFFSLGQVLPTHRASYSPHGGAFQATIPQAIRLLSAQPFGSLQPGSLDAASSKALGATDIYDPFTSGDGLTYSTDGHDSFVAPSIYAQNRLAWVHIFPEGCIHQHPSMTMRYFKWGVAQYHVGGAHLPRFLPRGGNKFHITFGELLDMEAKFGDLRRKWRELVRKDRLRALGEAGEDANAAKTGSGKSSSWASLMSLWSSKSSSTPTATTTPSSSPSSGPDNQLQQSATLQSQKRASGQLAMGELSEELKYGAEAQALRIEVARRVRDEIEKLRVSLGYPEDDPKLALAETWAKEPAGARRFKSEVDGSLVTKE
ncbi:hypothetical protein PG993_009768 [Apiospora rasikravindrae]|uniref:Tafazzin family protein n=1 Tax=Apiospora rasikravindrae TaxID=990691 RepID=A0ABR1SMN4_9PEZI